METIEALRHMTKELRGDSISHSTYRALPAQLLVAACLGAEIDVGDSIPRVHISDLSPLQFATEFVARNKPCIIQGKS